MCDSFTHTPSTSVSKTIYKPKLPYSNSRWTLNVLSCKDWPRHILFLLKKQKKNATTPLSYSIISIIIANLVILCLLCYHHLFGLKFATTGLVLKDQRKKLAEHSVSLYFMISPIPGQTHRHLLMPRQRKQSRISLGHPLCSHCNRKLKHSEPSYIKCLYFISQIPCPLPWRS